MFPVIFFAVGLILALIHIASLKKKTNGKVIELLLVYLMVFNMGIQAIFAATFQALQPLETAEKIGFAPSPFEFEVAMANLGMGIASLVVIFWRGRYILGPVIANTIFIYGAAYGHFVQRAQGDIAPYNTGIFVWAGDIIIPSIILMLTLFYYTTVISKAKK